MARITCGNCKNVHGSADAVRNCYRNSDWMKGQTPKVASAGIGSGVPITKWAKHNQRSAASPVVTLVSQEEARAIMAPPAKLPAGCYALEDPDHDGTVRFYDVSYGKPGGRWEGYTFVTHHVGPAEYPVRNRESRNAILSRISKNPAEAMARYGHAIGKCGKCGLRLTNDESRARGIGPICADKLGW